MKKTIVILLAPIYFMFCHSNAQATFTQGSNANQLATALSNTGFTISNPVLTNAGNRQRGVFSNGIAGAGLELDNGIILTTGRVNRSLNNTSNVQGDDNEQTTNYSDSDLISIEAAANYDTVVYEFDFVIAGTEPKIFALDYQFASEEYPDFVCSDKNDTFGFFVSGGDLVGSSNLASVGGNNVAVNYVNSGTAGTSGDPTINPCDLTQNSSFIDNAGGATAPVHIMYNGLTTTLRAYTILRPGLTYHMKMAIADTNDGVYDSGILISPIQIFDLPPKSDVDFDGADDYIDTQAFLGNFSGATMQAWFKLDAGFNSTGDICGQSNFKLFVDGSNRLKSLTKTGSSTYTYTLSMDDNSPADGWLGYVRIRINGGAWLQMNAGGFLTDWLQPQYDSTFTNVIPTDFSFEANPGDDIQIQYRRNGATVADMNDTTFQLRVEDGTVIHNAPYNSLSANTNNNYTASCSGCTPVVSRQTPNGSAPVLQTNMWYHATARFDGATGTTRLYLNGEQVWQGTGLAGNLSPKDDTFRFAIGRNSQGTNRYFQGNIDEVKLYGLALTDQQIQEQVYQEVENVNSLVTGSSIPKPIANGTLDWSDLKLYYDMDLIYDTTLIDNSSFAKNGSLFNITTVQAQTAPIPYVANNTGAWTVAGTWEYGNVWDIENLPNKDWAIVQIDNNAIVTTTNDHTHLGLLVESGAELEVNNDSGIFNTNYLKIDGVLDLQGESQLIQTTTSDLEVSSAGRLEVDQQGRADVYSYNNWSSPVGPINTTSNNNNYTVSQVLQDGTNPSSPQNITYTNGFDGMPTTPITLSNYWLFTYYNQPDNYANWVQTFETGTIRAGQAFTMKGPGSGANANTQNYVFNGKPNNGTIQHTITGTNLSLLGNPYPSAIDANQFITDNLSTIDEDGDVIVSGTTTGAIYVWEHFASNATHNLLAYEGGYATYNLAGATVAIPDPDVSSNGSGSVVLKRYIPVGQGFFVQSEEGGVVEFNNNQRAFEKESDGDSVFTFTGIVEEEPQGTTTTPSDTDGIDRLYFRFVTPAGPQRQLLLALKEGKTLNKELGWDAPLVEVNPSDASWILPDSERPFVIQTIGGLATDLMLPIDIKIGEIGTSKFLIESLEGINEDQMIYLFDKELNQYYNLRSEIAELDLAIGDYKNRFYLVFEKESEQQSDDIAILDKETVLYYDKSLQSIVFKSDTLVTINEIQLYSILGQEVLRKNNLGEVYELVIPVNMSDGSYIVKMKINNRELSKKLLITQ